FMKDGQVYNAILGEVEKEKALYRLFTWKDGKFEFIPQRVTTPQKIELPTGNLMMEGMQQIDEFERDKDKFPNKSSILQLKVDSTSVPKGLKPIIYEVLFLIDYYPKVENLVDHCSFTDYDVYTTIIDLVGRGVVDVTEVSEDIEMAELHTFISPSDAIKIKEKVVNRWDDMLTSNYAKIFIVSVNPELANKFILSCKSIPDFVIDSKLISDNNSTRNLLGQMGVLKLYGGLDMVFFSLPTASAMGPLINALSSNLVGLILLWDDTKLEWGSVVEGLAVTKNEILHHRKVPFLGVYCGENELTDELKESYIKTMGIEDNPETLMTFDNKNDESVQDILKKFFDELIKDKNKGSVKV
ncbi:MAG: DUF4388 domain-containing protein, partial [Deltaproteobacteria bacterium]|nr:DUF4388 domain-containing protein [Deltaproteobacteria bacterium]